MGDNLTNTGMRSRGASGRARSIAATSGVRGTAGDSGTGEGARSDVIDDEPIPVSGGGGATRESPAAGAGAAGLL